MTDVTRQIPRNRLRAGVSNRSKLLESVFPARFKPILNEKSVIRRWKFKWFGLSAVLFVLGFASLQASTAAIFKRAPHPKAAKAFMAFLTGPKGQAIYRRYGFMPPP